MTVSAFEYIDNLTTGDHLCSIYRTESEHRHAVEAFNRAGLRQGVTELPGRRFRNRWISRIPIASKCNLLRCFGIRSTVSSSLRGLPTPYSQYGSRLRQGNTRRYEVRRSKQREVVRSLLRQSDHSGFKSSGDGGRAVIQRSCDNPDEAVEGS